MSEDVKAGNRFIGYEYHSVSANSEMESIYVDGYENFGWMLEETSTTSIANNTIHMKFKRDRKICNKAELTRLQRQFDACIGELERLEKSKNSTAVITSLAIGILGCACMSGATFSYLAMMYPLMVILAIPGFICWIVPYFLYRYILGKQSLENAPLMEKKYDEIYEVCEHANQLLDHL